MAKGAVKRRVPDFRRAAFQHLEAARFLLESAGFRLQAMYLAGYAVECALKAMVVSRTPVKRQNQLLDTFRGSVSHDFEHLKARLARLKCGIPAEVVARMRPIATWSTDLRYAVGLREYDEASAFVDAADAVVKWMERSL